MPTFQNYFKIITPKTKATDYTTLATDSINPNQQGQGIAANISWYSQIMKGAGSRMQRYQQYDAMDQDIDISRALDIIAEEISNDDITTNLAFIIEYQNEGDEDVSDTVVTTIRAAVRQWTRVQDLNNRIFRISRYLAKYGDCFFKKSKDTRKWEFLDPTKVYGIEIDGDGNKVAYHIRGTGGSNGYSVYGAKASQIDVIPADAIIHFTRSDDMGEDAPFGESLLQPIFRTFKQLTALEDSVIIYRLVRAPERRVFYIDVGNMPAQRVKQYLESVKNELRQKRIPNTSSQGGEVVDGTFNPNSISEDIFLAQTAGGRGSRVETLPGGENLGELAELKYFRNKLYQGLRIPSSYMTGQDAQGAQYNDGKVGIAYIEELRFANFIRRVQNKVEQVMDIEFKKYLSAIGVAIDPQLFILRLPEPQNFGTYRQSALDSDLINAYKSIGDEKMLSARFKLKRYLGLTEDELSMNEVMLKQELGIDDTGNLDDIRQIYDPLQMDARKPVKIKPKIEDAIDKMAGGEDDGGNMPPDDGGGMPDEMGGGDEGGMPDLGGL
jgi:hypothetical protein